MTTTLPPFIRPNHINRRRMVGAYSFWLCVLILARSCHSYVVVSGQPTRIAPTIHNNSSTKTALHAKSNNRNIDKKTVTGVYVRPSGAIERGSGFFFPGLEGPKVRVLFGLVLIVLTNVNHSLWLGLEPWSITEYLSVAYAGLILFQATIEFGKDYLIDESNSSSSTAIRASSSSLARDDGYVQQWNSKNDSTAGGGSSHFSPSYRERVQWAAAAYVAMTPADEVFVLDDSDGISYRLGNKGRNADDENVMTAVQAAMTQLQQSRGGRVALPSTHPTVVGLGLSDSRTVLLQRVVDPDAAQTTIRRALLVVSSDQLVAAFTQSDLQWLGQMALYIQSQAD